MVDQKNKNGARGWGGGNIKKKRKNLNLKS